MRVGVFYFPTLYGIAIDELARELEARGFESLFVCEHTHIPVSRRSPFPGGGELPKRYSHTHDPRSGPKCHDCGATMRLFGIEPHPTIEGTDLLTFVCSHCDGVQTEIEPTAKLKPMGSLLAK